MTKYREGDDPVTPEQDDPEKFASEQEEQARTEAEAQQPKGPQIGPPPSLGVAPYSTEVRTAILIIMYEDGRVVPEHNLPWLKMRHQTSMVEAQRMAYDVADQCATARAMAQTLISVRQFVDVRGARLYEELSGRDAPNSWTAWISRAGQMMRGEVVPEQPTQQPTQPPMKPFESPQRPPPEQANREHAASARTARADAQRGSGPFVRAPQQPE